MKRAGYAIIVGVVLLAVVVAEPVAATGVGDVSMTVDDSAVTFVATCEDDFDWDMSLQGDSMTLTAECSLDTSYVDSMYGRLIQFHVTLELDKWNVPAQQWNAVQSDEWKQPSYPNRINTLVWPVNDYATDTLTVTWDNGGAGLQDGEQ